MDKQSLPQNDSLHLSTKVENERGFYYENETG